MGAVRYMGFCVKLCILFKSLMQICCIEQRLVVDKTTCGRSFDVSTKNTLYLAYDKDTLLNDCSIYIHNNNYKESICIGLDSYTGHCENIFRYYATLFDQLLGKSKDCRSLLFIPQCYPMASMQLVFDFYNGTVPSKVVVKIYKEEKSPEIRPPFERGKDKIDKVDDDNGLSSGRIIMIILIVLFVMCGTPCCIAYTRRRICVNSRDEPDARSISRPRNVNIISHDPSDLNPEILASQRQTGTNHVSFVSEPNTSVSNLHINVHLESQIGSYSVNPANESDNLNSGDDTTYSPKHWDPPPYDSLFPVQDDPDSAKM